MWNEKTFKKKWGLAKHNIRFMSVAVVCVFLVKLSSICFRSLWCFVIRLFLWTLEKICLNYFFLVNFFVFVVILLCFNFCLSPLEDTYKSTRSGFVRWRRQATGDRRPSSVQSRVKSRLTLYLTECSVWQLKESQIIDYACIISAEWGSIGEYTTLPLRCPSG